ncbi:Uma2 family endonuclease [Rhodoflexus sp.]
MQPTVITDLSQLDTDKVYTYADYLLWQLSERVELIKGKIFQMSPAPNKRHQRILRKLVLQVGNYLELQKKGCELFVAPFDVRLLDSKKSKKSDKDIYTVVQPDLCIICDASKLDDRGCIGAPDIIIEILSLGNSKKEMKTKYELYQENGVKEYWIVVPYEQFVQQFALNAEGKYELIKIYTDEDLLTTPLLPDLSIDLSRIFEE